MKFTDLPQRIQLSIQDAIYPSTENDVFPVDVDRVNNQALTVGCSHAGSNEIKEHFNLKYDPTTETFTVQN